MHICPGGIKSHKPKEGLLEPIRPSVATFEVPLLFPLELKSSSKDKIRRISQLWNANLGHEKTDKRFYIRSSDSGQSKFTVRKGISKK